MGIYAASEDRQRDALGASEVLLWIAVALAIASVATFALVGGGGAHSNWLAIALGEALLALALLMCSGPSGRTIGSFSPTSETNEQIDEAADRPVEARPPATLEPNRRQEPRAGQPISVAIGPGRATRAQRLAARIDPRRSRRQLAPSARRRRRLAPAHSDVDDMVKS
jgi:hypothetical protein